MPGACWAAEVAGISFTYIALHIRQENVFDCWLLFRPLFATQKPFFYTGALEEE